MGFIVQAGCNGFVPLKHGVPFAAPSVPGLLPSRVESSIRDTTRHSFRRRVRALRSRAEPALTEQFMSDLVVVAFLLAYPWIATPFFTYQIGAQALVERHGARG